MDESFKWSVDMDTTDDQIKALEANMLAFLTKEKRHFLPTVSSLIATSALLTSFCSLMLGSKVMSLRPSPAVPDEIVADFPDSEKLILKASIPYRSNWASGGVKVSRLSTSDRQLIDSLVGYALCQVRIALYSRSTGLNITQINQRLAGKYEGPEHTWSWRLC